VVANGKKKILDLMVRGLLQILSTRNSSIDPTVNVSCSWSFSRGVLA